VLSIPDSVTAQADAAATKVAGTRRPLRFVVAAMLAGMWIGIGVTLMLAAAGPFDAVDSPATRLVSGAVFAIALTFVVFAGGELATSAMMILPIGALRRTITSWQAARTLVFVFLGNLAGSLLFAWALIQTGILHSSATAGMLDGLLESKMGHSATEMLFGGILCNVLVSGAIWAASRVRSETAKAIVVFWGVLGFIAAGFEHVVANMTIYGLGVLGDASVDVSWAAFGTSMLWVGLGNLIGGMVVIGLAYAFVGGTTAEPATEGDEDPLAEAERELADVDARLALELHRADARAGHPAWKSGGAQDSDAN